MTALAREPDRQIDIELAKMRRRDLRRVLAIEGAVYPRPWSRSLFLSELAQRHTRTYLVARHEGQVVGYAGMMFTRKEAHVTNIAVAPERHGAGIGARLLLTLVTEAIARSCERISLEVRVSNGVAQNLYEKFGFSVEGVRKGYYAETNEDAFVMVVEDALSTDYRLRLQSIRDELREASPGDTFGE
ncbi:MAG: ribosomal protein S18-alanine N-acetyltransferase [Actinomycetota bacterium]|nr:ribosomal protein S18-alanine N-acetyltransferase [Actinomycetota bacterium]